jgi:hypothetical protein
MDEGVSEPFGGEKEQGEHGENDLEALGIELLFCYGLLTPLRCRTGTQAAHFPDYVQIQNGA